MEPLTNCKNCGAVLHGHKCEYCGTEYQSARDPDNDKLFGKLIRKWENDRPIADPPPDWEDIADYFSPSGLRRRR